MIGLGTLVNTAAIICGGIAGILVKGGLPERYKSIIIQAIGLSVVIIGVSGALQGIFTLVNGALDRQYIMLMIFSLVTGGVIGEWLSIEKRLESMGFWLQKKFSGGDSRFTQGFVTASLIYCVGAMAIIGSLEDGIAKNPAILFSKAVLDGVSAIIFGSSMGAGVIFSALPVLFYQGSITLLSGILKPLFTPVVITQVSLVGGVLIMCIGLNILEISKIKIGNLLPALFIPLAYDLLLRLPALFF